MRVTFLGVGAAFSRLLGNSSLLVESGRDRLVIDCGRTVPAALERLGLGLPDVGHVLITHLHADHIGGLEEAALMSRIFHRHRLTLVSTEALLDRLWTASLRGGLEYVELTPGDRTPQVFADFFDPLAVAPGVWIPLGERLRVHLRPTYHVGGMESYAVEVEEAPGGPTRRLLFTGDTRLDLPLIDYGVKECARIFHDCSLIDIGEGNELGVHTSYSQLKALPAALRARLTLYHYGDEPLPDAVGDGFMGFAEEGIPMEIGEG